LQTSSFECPKLILDCLSKFKEVNAACIHSNQLFKSIPFSTATTISTE